MRENKKDFDVPFKMFSNTKLLEDYDMEKSERISSQTSTKLKWTLDFANKEIFAQKIEKWGDQSRKNPNQMIRKLQNIKSEN